MADDTLNPADDEGRLDYFEQPIADIVPADPTPGVDDAEMAEITRRMAAGDSPDAVALDLAIAEWLASRDAAKRT